jgi:hypothetical protein
VLQAAVLSFWGREDRNVVGRFSGALTQSGSIEPPEGVCNLRCHSLRRGLVTWSRVRAVPRLCSVTHVHEVLIWQISFVTSCRQFITQNEGDSPICYNCVSADKQCQQAPCTMHNLARLSNTPVVEPGWRYNVLQIVRIQWHLQAFQVLYTISKATELWAARYVQSQINSKPLLRTAGTAALVLRPNCLYEKVSVNKIPYSRRK